jgi:hypothetical protein
VRPSLCVLLFVASCAHAPPTGPAPDVDHVSGPGYEGVIFSAEYARTHDYWTSMPVWTVTRGQVDAFERALARLLAKRHETLPTAFPIKRQYLGVFEYGTQRRLLRARLLGPSLYSEDRVQMLPDFEYVPSDAVQCIGWYDPAARKIIDFGCFMAPGVRERFHDLDRPPPPPPPPPMTLPPTDPLPPNL